MDCGSVCLHPLDECCLSCVFVVVRSWPERPAAILKCATKTEGHMPWPRILGQLVESSKIIRRHFLALPTRQEKNSWNGGGHMAGQCKHRQPSHLLRARLGCSLESTGNQVGLEEGPLQEDVLLRQGLVHFSQNHFGNLETSLCRMVPCPLNIRLYNGDQTVALGNHGILGSVPGSLHYGCVGRQFVSNFNHHSPFGETCA